MCLKKQRVEIGHTFKTLDQARKRIDKHPSKTKYSGSTLKISTLAYKIFEFIRQY